MDVPRKIDDQHQLDQVTTSVRTGRYMEPGQGRTTLDEYFDGYAARQLWEAGTEHAMRLAVSDGTFSNVPLAELTRGHVDAWIRDTSKRLTSDVVRTRFNIVLAAVRGAVKDKRLAENFMRGVRLSSRGSKETRPRMPPQQVGALLAASDDQSGAFWALATFAGLRLGEAAGLKPKDFDFDFDFEERTTWVERKVQRVPGGVEIREPKYGSHRTVYASDGLMDLPTDHVDAEVFGEK